MFYFVFLYLLFDLLPKFCLSLWFCLNICYLVFDLFMFLTTILAYPTGLDIKACPLVQDNYILFPTALVRRTSRLKANQTNQ